MASEGKSNHWLWLLLLLLLLLWWWWSRKPGQAASSPAGPAGPVPQSQPQAPPQVVVDTFTPPPTVTGSSQTSYATFNPDSYAPETRAALNTVSYVDPGTGLARTGRSFLGLYDAYVALRDSGSDVADVVAQMESAIRGRRDLFPNPMI